MSTSWIVLVTSQMLQTPTNLFLTSFISFWPGSNFLCATHIIPVKNEEGVVIMFILNFDYILNEGSSDSLERLNQTSPSKADQCEWEERLTLASQRTTSFRWTLYRPRPSHTHTQAGLQRARAAVPRTRTLLRSSVGMLTQAFSRR